MKIRILFCASIMVMLLGQVNAQTDEPKKIYLFVNVKLDQMFQSLPYKISYDFFMQKGLDDLKRILNDQLPDKDILCDTFLHGLVLPDAFLDSSRTAPLMIDGNTRSGWLASIDSITFQNTCNDTCRKILLSFHYTIWNNRIFRISDMGSVQATTDSMSQPDYVEQVMLKIADPILNAMPSRVRPKKIANDADGNSIWKNMKLFFGPILKTTGNYLKKSVGLENYEQSHVKLNVHFVPLSSYDYIAHDLKSAITTNYVNTSVPGRRPRSSVGLEFSFFKPWLIEVGRYIDSSKYRITLSTILTSTHWETDQTITLGPPVFINTRYLVAAFPVSSAWLTASVGAGMMRYNLNLSGHQYSRPNVPYPPPPPDKYYQISTKHINDYYYQFVFEFFPVARLGIELKIERHFTNSVTVPEQSFTESYPPYSNTQTVNKQKIKMPGWLAQGGLELVVFK